ncbi:hypothetical protein ACFW04_010277 [Cataglyphis niger]
MYLKKEKRNRRFFFKYFNVNNFYANIFCKWRIYIYNDVALLKRKLILHKSLIKLREKLTSLLHYTLYFYLRLLSSCLKKKKKRLALRISRRNFSSIKSFINFRWKLHEGKFRSLFCARNPRRIGILIIAVWVISLGISLAPQLGWKDPDYLDRIAQGTCLVSQDTAYQIFATCATFYLPLLVILFLYWRIFQAARKRIRKRPGTILQPPRERRGILRLVTRRPREESTAFTITRSTPDHSSISPEKSSSYNGANVTPSTTVTPTAVSTTTTTTTLTNPTSTSQQQQVVKCMKRTRETIESKRERKAAKTLAIITGAFVACWLPFFLVALLQATCQTCEPPKLVASVFLWLGYFNSTLNPVIYTVFSPEFRQAFKRMLCGGTRGLR